VEVEREAFDRPSRRISTWQPFRITLSASRDIPFNKLVLSQANVRRTKTGVSIEDLAEDIARRTLLQSLSVRPVLDAQGKETGMFEVPAGGRRFQALELLVRQKRMTRTQPVPCVVREGGLAEEDSLTENVQRVALHPLDQFRAFQTLREKGLCQSAPKRDPESASNRDPHRRLRSGRPRSPWRGPARVAQCPHKRRSGARGEALWTPGGDPRAPSGPVFEAPALVAGFEDVAVMGQPVEQRRGHLGVGEDARPFGKGEIG
jgi:hypothetical protein